ncbi:uncharacterized protein LOC120358881 [Solenopsis invicta]|uniref:uncharacterized protein LOC120358881 n=1 Tax=Solenopsis invicta TaxID=13686 RepID=UPI00193DA465|nr:uncharacterized protein LOC120358881 [Solenopsis invicta]
MLRGIATGWKIPLGYYYCESSTNHFRLMRCIQDNVRTVTHAGLNLVATVCDQGSANMSALRKFRKQHSIRTGIPENMCTEIDIANCSLITIYDPPHLLKGIRNNLLTKDLEINYATDRPEKDRQYATWLHIDKAYEIDVHECTINRAMPKLTDQHIKVDKIRKMKVKNAAQIFSRSVSLFLQLAVLWSCDSARAMSKDICVPAEASHTSHVCIFFNNLFDSVNANSVSTKNNPPLRTAVTKTSQHLEFWKDASRTLKSMRYVHRKTKKPTPTVPSLKNWNCTIEGMATLWAKLESMGFKYFKTRNVNQDPLENFFGAIRSHGQRYVSPTAWQFDGLYKTLLLNNVSSLHSVGANCEKDDGDFLLTFNSFINNAIKESSNDDTTNAELFDDSCVTETVQNFDANNNNNFAKGTRMYVAGWMARKLLNSVKECRDCSACQCSFSSNSHNDPEYTFIKIREFDSSNHALAYINMDYFEMYVKADKLLRGWITNVCFKSNVAKRLRLALRKRLHSEWIKCRSHQRLLFNKFLQLFVRIFLFHWSNVINRVMNGLDTRMRPNDIMIKQAIKKCAAIRSRNCKKLLVK